MMKKSICRFVLLLIVSMSFCYVKSQNDFEIAKNVDIFVSVLKELNAKYADEINPGDLTKSAIDAMLLNLDPYTVYYPDYQLEDVRMMTTGQYGGIGALIHQNGNYVVISEPYEGTPAQEAGLRAGDKFLKINGKSAVNKKSDEVSSFLKGEPGSTLTVEVERYGEPKPLVFTLKRKEIKMPNIPYFGLIDNKTGYIKLDQFMEKSGTEVREAFNKLKADGMNALILDLRGNGGGLLNEAVNIMNIFIDKGTVIAETKGKLQETVHKNVTQLPVLDRNIPVVVLVNESSASASEIVSGAFQDLDRGLIVGKKTFGKGLVQNIVPLSYNSSLKITISKYYIPSGRCVQNVDYFSKDSIAQRHIPDSLARPFKTKNGRTVYDKGGIEPDMITPDTIASNLLVTLVYNSLIFDFATQYRQKYDAIGNAQDFKVDDELYEDFVNFLKDKQYSYNSETENLLKELKKTAMREKYFSAVEPLYNEMKNKIEADKKSDLMKYKDEIKQYLASEIVARYYYQKGRIINNLMNDPDISMARNLLSDKASYNRILSGK
ncbi:MAG: S41 family peptidase [Bacteroidales bacterium]|jgi:carboxyl-terminal processing protease|nr:S41 family peptidase [Bacteroidales bacterium]